MRNGRPIDIGVGIADLVRFAAEEAGEPVSSILSSERGAYRQFRARQVAMYLARRRLRASIGVVGRALQRDHTTVCNGDRRIAELVAAGDPFTCDLVARVESRITARAAA